MGMTPSTHNLLREAATAFREHPERFFSYALQTERLPRVASPLVVGGLSQGQHTILSSLNRAVAARKPLYIASGHAMGKDFLAGGIPLWWQTTRYPAKSILTGPTERQVHEITWNELTRHVGRWHPALPPLGGRLTQSKLEWDAEHFILAFTSSQSEQHVGKAQGFHAPNLLIGVTESQAVPNSIKEQLDGLMASGETLFIAIGNPLVTTGWFADGLRRSDHHVVIHLDCETSPNVLENREVIPGLCSRAWVDQKRRAWYADNPNHPLWLSRVKGQLPLTSVDSVFDRDLIARSWQYPLRDRGVRVSLGVDVAEFGDDESVFCCLADGLVRRAHVVLHEFVRGRLENRRERCTHVLRERPDVGSHEFGRRTLAHLDRNATI